MFAKWRNKDEELRELREEIKDRARDYKKLNDEMSELKQENFKLSEVVKERSETIGELKSEIEKLEWERDLLYKYYDIQKDPTQEERTAMRTDLRVHNLELVNLELRLKNEKLLKQLCESLEHNIRLSQAGIYNMANVPYFINGGVKYYG